MDLDKEHVDENDENLEAGDGDTIIVSVLELNENDFFLVMFRSTM